MFQSSEVTMPFDDAETLVCVSAERVAAWTTVAEVASAAVPRAAASASVGRTGWRRDAIGCSFRGVGRFGHFATAGVYV